MKIRTIKSAAIELKRDDPNCAVTEYFIRKLCIENRIPFRKSGRKYLVDVDDIITYLQNPT